MKTISNIRPAHWLIFILANWLIFIACSKNDNDEPVAPPTTQVETPEHLKGWTPQPKVDSAQPYMAFATGSTSATTLSLTAVGATATATDVWVDTNNNGIFDEGLDKRITDFSKPITFTAASGVFTVYGKVKELTATGNALTAADVRKNEALTKLNVADNQLSEKAMLNLVNSLPAATASGTTAVVLCKAEGDSNSVTDAVRKAVTAKGWQALRLNSKGEVEEDKGVSQPKEGVMLDNIPKEVLSVEYEINNEGYTQDNSYTFFFYLSEDHKERIEISLSDEYHIGKTIDLTKRENENVDETYWLVEYYNGVGRKIIESSGYDSSGTTLFKQGKLNVSGTVTTTLSFLLENGIIEGKDDQKHSFSINYKGTFERKKDKTAPKVGTITQAEAANYNEAIIKWTAATDNRTPNDDLLYQVWWKEKGGSGVQVSGIQKQMLQYKIKGLKEKTTYIVWVTVYDKIANEGTYAQKEFTTPDAADTELPKVGGVQVNNITYNKATVKWTAATDNRTPQAKLSYKLFWKEKGTSAQKSVDIPKGASLSYELKELKENVAYIVWVTVRDEAGNVATYSEKDFTTPLDSLPIKAGTLILDGVESQILKADYSETTAGNYQINFYLSSDGSRKISFLVNDKLHIGSTVDLTKKEESYEGKKNWYIWYKDAFFSTGRRASSQPVFDTGSLRVSNLPTEGNITVELKDGRIKVNGGAQRTITLKYKGTISAQPYREGNVVVINGEERKIINTRFHKSKSKSCDQYIITFTFSGSSGEESIRLELYDKWHWDKKIDLRMVEAPQAYIDGYTIYTFENWGIDYYKEDNRVFGATSLNMSRQFDKGELITRGDTKGLVKIKIENGVVGKYTLSLNYEGELE